MTRKFVGVLHQFDGEFFQIESIREEITGWTAASSFNPDVALLSSLFYKIKVGSMMNPNSKEVGN